MPTDLAKKWTGGDCGLRQSTGNADRTIDLARLRECDLRKDDLTSLGYRASLAGFVTHTANLDCNTSRRLSRRFPTFHCLGHDSSFSNSFESDPGTLIWMP
jgi:hypothetical protein